MNFKKSVAIGLSTLAVGGLLLVSQPGPLFAEEASSATTASTQTSPGTGLGLGRLQGGLMSIISDLLGMDQDELRLERQSGKSFVEIGAVQGVDEQEMVDAVTSSRTQIVEEKQQEGVITAEQAEDCLENMNANIEANLNRTEVGPPAGAMRQGLGKNANTNSGQSFGQGMGKGFGHGQGNGVRTQVNQ